jgi:CopG family nickel-responsive transcriptional regulator
MQRFTVSIEPKLAAEFDALIERRAYGNRSEAFRDLLRAELERQRDAEDPQGWCVACLSYVYNHHERDLAERLNDLQHAQHDLIVSTMHAHLDHDNCIETVLLRGTNLGGAPFRRRRVCRAWRTSRASQCDQRGHADHRPAPARLVAVAPFALQTQHLKRDRACI